MKHQLSTYFLGVSSLAGSVLSGLGLRSIMMEHHMICAEICKGDDSLECPVPLRLLDEHALMTFWLPLSLALAALVTILWLYLSRPGRNKRQKAPEIQFPQTDYHPIETACLHFDLPAARHQDGPIFIRRVRTLRMPRNVQPSIRCRRFNSYPYHWIPDTTKM